MRCDQATAYVDVYADGELGAFRRVAFRRHLAACPGCAARLDEALALKARIRNDAPRYAAPPELRAHVTALAASARDGATSARSRNGGWRWAAAGAFAGSAATVLVLFAGTAVLDQRGRDDVALAAVDDHVRATLSDRLIEVASSDQHTVKPWLSARLDYSPPVRDYADLGFPLVGARLERLGGRPVATLVYRIRLHTIDVYVRPHGEQPAFPPPRTIRGFNVLAAEGGGMDWLVVSDASVESLAPLVRELATLR